MLLVAGVSAAATRNSERTEVRADAPTTSTSIDETTTSTSSTTALPSTTLRLPAPTIPPTAVDNCTSGRPIVFVRGTQSPPIWHVWTVRPDGSCRRQITKGDGHVLNWGASLSPDGTRLAFVRKDTGVMLANADGSNERLLLAETNSQQPSSARTQWSPDGSTIVVGRQEGVWTIEVATGKAFQLAGGQAHYPSWSPDGTKVVFADYGQPEGGPTIEVINRDGTGRRTIGRGGNDPYWSVTNRIVHGTGSGPLVVMDADGNNATPIPGTDNLGFPIWSPDGAWIVASKARGGMVLVRPDGSGRAELNTGGDDMAFGWA